MTNCLVTRLIGRPLHLALIVSVSLIFGGNLVTFTSFALTIACCRPSSPPQEEAAWPKAAGRLQTCPCWNPVTTTSWERQTCPGTLNKSMIILLVLILRKGRRLTRKISNSSTEASELPQAVVLVVWVQCQPWLSAWDFCFFFFLVRIGFCLFGGWTGGPFGATFFPSSFFGCSFLPLFRWFLLCLDKISINCVLSSSQLWQELITLQLFHSASSGVQQSLASQLKASMQLLV